MIRKLTAILALLALASCVKETRDPAPTYTNMFNFDAQFVESVDTLMTIDILPSSANVGTFWVSSPAGTYYGSVFFTQEELTFWGGGLGLSATSLEWNWIWSHGQWRLSFSNVDYLFVESN